MGFFDNFIDENASSSSSTSTGSSSGGATAVAEPPKKLGINKKSNDSDFLIIDDSVTSETIPSTVSDIFATESKQEEMIGIVSAPDEIVILDEAPVAADIEELPEVTDVKESAELVDEVVIEEIPVPEVIPEEVVVEDAAPVEVAEVAPMAEVSFLDSVMTEAPVALSLATTEEVSSSSLESSESAVRQAIEKIADSIKAKEAQRDAKISENERILSQIADLKKSAKLAQDEAREIDASADHDRKLVEGLKTLIAV